MRRISPSPLTGEGRGEGVAATAASTLGRIRITRVLSPSMPLDSPGHDRDVVITGVGVVSPIGVGREAFWTSLLSGKSGVGPITRFDSSGLPVHFAAEVKDFDAKAYIKPRKS